MRAVWWQLMKSATILFYGVRIDLYNSAGINCAHINRNKPVPEPEKVIRQQINGLFPRFLCDRSFLSDNTKINQSFQIFRYQRIFLAHLCVVRWFYSHRVRSFLHGTVRTFLHDRVRSFLHRPVITFLHPLRRVLSQEESAVHPLLYTVSSTQERRPLCWQKQKCRKYKI